MKQYCAYSSQDFTYGQLAPNHMVSSVWREMQDKGIASGQITLDNMQNLGWRVIASAIQPGVACSHGGTATYLFTLERDEPA